jgi:enoyl-CoA hydratase/carnithine racemase
MEPIFVDDNAEWTTFLDEPGITAARNGGAVKITFNRPDRLNALTLAATRVFRDVVQDVAADTSVTAVMLTGSGRAFSAGADLGGSFNAESLAALPDHLRTVTTPTILALRTMPKPVIAAVNGAAAGVGCSFAIAADLVLASDAAKFVMSFSKIGLSLDGGASAMLTARAGFGRAMRMSLLAEPIRATEALHIGLADKVIPAAEFSAGAHETLLALAGGPVDAFAATKRLINAVALPQIEQALEDEARTVTELINTADFREAIAATGEGRAPVFGRTTTS